LLTQNGGPANGVFDFQFRLFASSNAVGISLGAALLNDTTATNGLFNVQLDFGVSPFSGPARWLEIAVRPGANTGAYTTITPLQPVTPSPYAITALGAAAGSINASALALNVETLDESFAVSAFARTDNRSTNGFDLKLRITNRSDSVVAAAETSSSILGLDSATVGGRPAVAFPVVGCVVSAIPSTNVSIRQTCWLNNSPVDCDSVVIDYTEFVTNTYVTTNFTTNCSSPLIFARGADEAGHSWNTTLITTGSAAEPSLAVVNGTPTIAYDSPSSSSWRVVEATSSTGTNWGGTVSVANHADVGRYCSPATVNARPAISYFNATSNNLEYVRFNARNWSSRVVVEGTGGAGRHGSLAVVNGQPAIACFRSTIVGAGGALVYYRANDLNGSTWGARTTVDSNVGDLNTGSAVTNGSVIALALVEGRPAIAYFDQGEDVMKYVRASDSNGTAWGTPVSLPLLSISGGSSSAAKGGSCRLAVLGGRPTVQFAAGQDIYVVTARNAEGTSWGFPVQIVNGSTSTAWAGGLWTVESQYASAFQIYRPSFSAPPQILFTRREPPQFAISWIAVQP
jgi:hypothetical protein